MVRMTGAATTVVAVATATCGLFMISGFGPASSASTIMPAVTPLESVKPAVEATEPVSQADDSTTTSTITTTTTTTTTPSTSTSTTTSTTTTTAVPLTMAPIAVVASNTVVGAGGTITFDGACAEASPVSVRIVGRTTQVVDVGTADTEWTYTWTAPTDETEFGSFTFRFFCGEPAEFLGTYPSELVQRVDMVASAAPPPTLFVQPLPLTTDLPETD